MKDGYFEQKNNINIQTTAGVDEAGRGPLAGPVVAAAVILRSPDFKYTVKDSKKLSPLMREKLLKEIIKNSLSWKVKIIDVEYINQNNILNASLEAMKQTVLCLGLKPQLVLVDGNQKIPDIINQMTIIKGDENSILIACASILAKVIRDKIMLKYDEIFPYWGFAKHKGYGTKLHMENLKKYGASPIHRKYFKPVCDIRNC